MTLIAIWASNWSMQVSVPFGPSAQRFGEHCKATTTAAASAHMVEMANPSDKKSKMFEA